MIEMETFRDLLTDQQLEIRELREKLKKINYCKGCKYLTKIYVDKDNIVKGICSLTKDAVDENDYCSQGGKR